MTSDDDDDFLIDEDEPGDPNIGVPDEEIVGWEDIEGLREDAMEAGNDELYDLCTAAIDGDDEEAKLKVVHLIRELRKKEAS